MEFTLNSHELNRLRRGDRIVQIDGRNVDFTVVRPPHTLPNSTTVAIAVKAESGREANLYPDSNIERNVTVRRPERAVTRTVAGLKLRNSGDKHWTTVDGKYEIAYLEQGLSECENPHPMAGGDYCPGHQYHEYFGWSVWDVEGDDYAFDIRNEKSMSSAAEDLVRALRNNSTTAR